MQAIPPAIAKPIMLPDTPFIAAPFEMTIGLPVGACPPVPLAEGLPAAPVPWGMTGGVTPVFVGRTGVTPVPVG